MGGRQVKNDASSTLAQDEANSTPAKSPGDHRPVGANEFYAGPVIPKKPETDNNLASNNNSTAGAYATSPTSSAGGSIAVGADSRLQSCAQPVGTIRLQDDMASADTPSNRSSGANENLVAVQSILASLARLGGSSRPSALPASGGGVSLDSLRLLIQQSNCFAIVDRGAPEAGADDEKRRTRSPNNEVRDGANMGPGQEVAADYVLRSSVVSMETSSSRGLSFGGLMPKFLGGGSAGQSVSEAKVQLILSDVRSKLQVAVAQGEGSGSNTRMAANILGAAGKGIGGLGLSNDSNTSSTTILLQAFADAYNKMVPALQNYKTQSVKGGLGNGGTLGVQGSRTDASAMIQK